jgi:hypothetical protein
MYFLYSDEQVKEKNKALERAGKRFVPGTIVVNGKKKMFSQLSSPNTLQRFVDTKVIAEGDPKNFIYTDPKMESR